MGNYAGWMQGLGLDPSLLDEHGGYMVEGDVDGEMVDGEEGEDQDGMMMGKTQQFSKIVTPIFLT